MNDPRADATITALQLALEQAVDLVEQVGTGGDVTGVDAELVRLRAMAAPGWEALPLEPNGPSGE